METIAKLWFNDGRIYILTDKGNTYSRPLEAFPLLLKATPEQRTKYEIGLDGDDIHWDDIDEDIHISSFFMKEEPDTNNPIAAIFEKLPTLSVSKVARKLGIKSSLLSRYIYGIKKPTDKREEEILEIIHQGEKDIKKGNYEIIDIDKL